MKNGIPGPMWNPVLWMSRLIVGSMVMARLSNEFKFKMPKREIAIWAIGGGILMGIGSRPAWAATSARSSPCRQRRPERLALRAGMTAGHGSASSSSTGGPTARWRRRGQSF